MSADLVDVIGGSFAASALLALQETGSLDRLVEPVSAPDLATATGSDPALLGGLLTFLAGATSIVEQDNGRFQLALPYRRYNTLGFQLDKFLRAYGPAMASLGRSLTGTADRQALVNRAALANAFARRTSTPPTLTAELLRAWSVTALLDLGCGAGSLLIELAGGNPEFRGWGLDASAEMVAAATAGAQEAGVAHQLGFDVADARGIVADTVPALPPTAALHARSLLNEFFASGPEVAVEVLTQIRQAFPDRLIFIEDYYGRLGVECEADFRHARLQDMVQLASAQGVPPPDLAAWAEVYAKAGCSLLHAYEGTDDGVAWFIHVCAL